ncbi:MAG: SAM-dependent methyltransferase [Streptosporangiaceae bacterium]
MADLLPDASVPHCARVYAYLLGTKDHFQADRDVAREVMLYRPQAAAMARANRAFGRRATIYAAHARGIRQFLDIGTGLPAPDATHEVAHRARRGSRVVYVDNDPVVVAHARALLTPATTASGTCDCIDADVRDPVGLLDKAAAVLDLTRPVAVWLLAVLHFLPDSDDPAGVVAELAAALAPGSVLAISHLTDDLDPGSVTAAIASYNARMPSPVYPRCHDEVCGLFGELPLHWPGVVPVTRWRPSFQEAPGSRSCDIYGGLAVVPSAGATPQSGLTAGPEHAADERAAS